MKLLPFLWSMSFLLAACGKSEDSSADPSDGGGSKSSTNRTDAGDKPWDDPTKPFLDDRKMENFVASLKDPNGPFDAVSKGRISAFNAGARMEEFDAAARKHGFSSGEEYLGAWVRIGTAQTLVMTEEMNRSMARSHEEIIRNSQEALKTPDVTPEARQGYEDQIKASREALDALKQAKSDESFNEQDIATYKKHRAAFEEAVKKWNTKQD